MTTPSARAPAGSPDFEAFLRRESLLGPYYAALGREEPPEAVDTHVIGYALVAARSASAARKSAAPPATAVSEGPRTIAAGVSGSPPPRPHDRDDEDDDDDDDAGDVDQARRLSFPPRARLYAGAGAAAIIIAGLWFGLMGGSPGDDPADNGATAARERAERRDARAAEAARKREAREAPADAADAPLEFAVDDSVPAVPPPIPAEFLVMPAEGNPVLDEDLDRAIALIRRDLIASRNPPRTPLSADGSAAATSATGTSTPGAAPDDASIADAAVDTPVQPRERRLEKVLELFDSGSRETAAASLGIFIRDFPDDPVSAAIAGGSR